jgi:hypothetical protein
LPGQAAEGDSRADIHAAAGIPPALYNAQNFARGKQARNSAAVAIQHPAGGINIQPGAGAANDGGADFHRVEWRLEDGKKFR